MRENKVESQQMAARMAIENPMSSPPPVTKVLLAWADYWYPVSWKCVLLAGAITAVGACVTMAFLMLQWRASGIRETHAEWRRAILEYQFAELKAEASDELAHLNTVNAEITNLTQSNQALSRMIQPRHLSGGQISDIARSWKTYSGHSVTLWSDVSDIEANALSEQIEKCLIGARLVVVNNIGRMTASWPPHTGIEVAGVDKHLVAALLAGLGKIGGLKTSEIDLADRAAAELVPAEIFVGTKPLLMQN
jgi:hypothetical protein